MSKKVLVVMGGFSAERDVSMVSGKGIASALQTEGYDVIMHDLTDVADFIEVLKPSIITFVKSSALNQW